MTVSQSSRRGQPDPESAKLADSLLANHQKWEI
jgi:hypothetical protein